jgi:hypothetical protein
MGRTSGLPGTGCAAKITEPQLEQNRALCGNPVPQRLQKTAISLSPSPETPFPMNIREPRRPGSMRAKFHVG